MTHSPIEPLAKAHGMTTDLIEAYFAESDGLVVADEQGRYPTAAIIEAIDSLGNAYLEDIDEALSDLTYARESVKAAEQRLREEVQTALSEGIAAWRLAEHMGVSRSRIYQLRDGKR